MKANITIEMTDEEYEAYKDFINGKYGKKEQVENDITKYLEATGFKKVNSTLYRSSIDPLGRGADAVELVYKKEKVRVVVDIKE